MTNLEIRKAREVLDMIVLAKNRKEKIQQKIRELRAEMNKEDELILSYLAVLDDMKEAWK